MSIKSTIAAAAASPFLFAGAAFAGPYVNLEATGSYPDGAYSSGGLEAVVGYEGETPSGIAKELPELLIKSSATGRGFTP